MGQAKTLTPAEIDQVLTYISTRSYALRNRALFLTSLYSGMRAKEMAALTVEHVVNLDGTIKGEIRLAAAQTKGKHSRTVFISDKLRMELQRYLDMRRVTDSQQPLFITSGRKAFSATGMAQHFFWMYRHAGVVASSHSGRRSFATAIAANGTSMRVLMKLMGHRHISTTAIYVEASDDMLRKAVELM